MSKYAGSSDCNTVPFEDSLIGMLVGGTMMTFLLVVIAFV